ncbi:MAG TPA: precorrin-3B C(17)-methyltransferase [Actinocrinis sp.]|nr:precorrin-3B C(17)-methyltransferase [Actinocrinis sp.]
MNRDGEEVDPGARHGIGLVWATESGLEAAAYLGRRWGEQVRAIEAGSVADALRTAYRECEAVIAFLATGATVRVLAPLLGHKTTDPPVVCVDESREYAIALLGGHYGANDLARRVADALSCPAGRCRPVISNARDSTGVNPLPPEPSLAPEPVVPTLVVGVGSSRGASADEILSTVDAALAVGGLSPDEVATLASVDLKADEPGLLAAADRRGWPIAFHPAAELAPVDVPNPSAVVQAATGTASVAEAAARYAGPGRPWAELLVPKVKSAMVTAAVARQRPRGRLAVVGLGPGARDLLAPRAAGELRAASVLVGLDQYVDQIRDLLPVDTQVHATGLGSEEARARSAVDLARAGAQVVLIGSGDAGVYAMASPTLDYADTEDVDVVCVPGITAATAASNVLGAPLGHDHCSISLSDLHTPWAAIERRIRAAAEGDFVVSFYNPRSRKRDWQLPAALEILAARRPPQTPIGWVRNASRPDQTHGISTLSQFDPAVVDMYTVVTVGCSQSRIVAGRFVTPRGYTWAE